MDNLECMCFCLDILLYCSNLHSYEYLQIIGSTLKTSLTQVVTDVISYAPVVLIAVVLVVIGFVLGNILVRSSAFYYFVKIDKALGTAGLNNLSEQVGVKVSVAKTLECISTLGNNTCFRIVCITAIVGSVRILIHSNVHTWIYSYHISSSVSYLGCDILIG